MNAAVVVHQCEHEGQPAAAGEADPADEVGAAVAEEAGVDHFDAFRGFPSSGVQGETPGNQGGVLVGVTPWNAKARQIQNRAHGRWAAFRIDRNLDADSIDP